MEEPLKNNHGHFSGGLPSTNSLHHVRNPHILSKNNATENYLM
jgi:hypothetical protein